MILEAWKPCILLTYANPGLQAEMAAVHAPSSHAFLVQALLQGTADVTSHKSLLDAAEWSMLTGNKAYDNQRAVPLLHVGQVLGTSPGVTLSLTGEKFVAPDALCAVPDLLAAAAAGDDQ